jgi:hypothetical protein
MYMNAQQVGLTFHCCGLTDAAVTVCALGQSDNLNALCQQYGTEDAALVSEQLEIYESTYVRSFCVIPCVNAEDLYYISFIMVHPWIH